MIKPSDLDPSMREWLFAREVMRRLGFSADDLYFACQPAGRVIEQGVAFELEKPVILLSLKAQGKQFTWTIGTVDIPVDKIEQAYIDACELWNYPDTSWRDPLWIQSIAFQRKIELVTMLKSKGFVFGDGIIN